MLVEKWILPERIKQRYDQAIEGFEHTGQLPEGFYLLLEALQNSRKPKVVLTLKELVNPSDPNYVPAATEND